MPGPKKQRPSSDRLRKRTSSAAGASTVRRHTLLVIDNRPLQRAAWAEFHTVRKRLEKTARDLHRHEEIDRPAYDTWLYRTFPLWLTRLRELYAEVSTKSRQVQTVIAMAQLTGRSLKKLWREQMEYEANPEAFDAKSNAEETDSHRNKKSSDGPAFSEEDFSEDNSTSSQRARRDSNNPAHRTPASVLQAAKDIYRRLVQHLHPDRGGDWTPTRQRLWHEVQQAWVAGDTDWLARLEVEWETANEVLSPDSPVSRLRRAIEELTAARRDIERKLREYRRAPQWRFTLTEKRRHLLHARTYANFRHDVHVLQQQLEHLNRTIATWEKSGADNHRSRRSTRKRAFD